MNKPRILVLYYTQSGQMRHILDHVLQDITGKCEIDYAEIKPVKPFPWPWTAYTFFDAMPETVEHVPVPLQPLPQDIFDKQYDLVVIGYQPWFLNPSQPTNSFLQLDDAKKLLNGKPVITVIGCRNMWLHGQEKVKEYLTKAGASLKGNIVLTDTHPNLISLLTIIRWAFSGRKEAKGMLPAAGVQENDIRRATRFGAPIYRHLTEDTLDSLQDELLLMGAIHLNPGLVLLEKRGIKNFRYWAKYIRAKGGPGDPNRKGRVNLFKRLLLTGIFILSPISSATAAIQLQLQKKSLLKDVDYFKKVGYEPKRL